MSVKDFVGKFKEMVEADCVDDCYTIVGTELRSTATLIEAGAESVRIITERLQGWGYSVHAIVEFGGGFKMSIFAR